MRFILLLPLLLACEPEPTPSGTRDLDAEVDASRLPDARMDRPPVDAAPDLGAFGEPCEDNTECRSGYCIEAPRFGRICTQACGECPVGFECEPVANGGADNLFLCLADQPDLCKPCSADRECDDNEDLCLAQGPNQYCGEACDAEDPCPDGFECVEVRGSQQCVPAGGETCQPCMDRDGDGYGEGGDCLGPDCNDEDEAIHPEAMELCDQVDQDCDSMVDEEATGAPEEGCPDEGVCEGALMRCRAGEWGCGLPDTHEAEEARCDGLDNDCDGATDEGLLGTPLHCGFCGQVCAFANAGAACLEQVCSLGDCREGFWDVDGIAGNGCEYACQPSREGVEVCDLIDNDCDGEVDENALDEVCDGVDNDCDEGVDEGFDLQGDPSHCGACDAACAYANGEPACEEGECVLEACDAGFHDANDDLEDGCEYACLITLEGQEACDDIDNDCDGVVDEVGGEEICGGGDEDCDGSVDEGFDLANDPENCGLCGRVCALPNASSRCAMSECRVAECLGGFWEVDGLAETGCEYACQPTLEGVEGCDEIDNDCDGLTDEGVRNRCGGCGPEPEEVCNGLDEDCDEVSDEGVLNRCGACGPEPAEVCNGGDDDCDGSTDEGTTNRCGGCGPEPAEVCNGGDDDCDGSTDEGTTNRCGGCGPEPAEVCNGLDDDCNGTVDDHGVCGPYVQQRCRLFVGWADNNRGPASPSNTWGGCPASDFRYLDDNRCLGTRRDGRFMRLDLDGNVDENDQLAFAFLCDDAANPPLAAYLQTHCAAYMGHADNERGPDNSEAWGPCPGVHAGASGLLRCMSSGYDGRFRKMTLAGNVDENDDFGVAFKCRDPADPGRAAELQASVEIFLGWADLDRGPASGAASWATCPQNSGGDLNDTRCVGTRGDGRFHRLRLRGVAGGDVDDNDDLGLALRARAAP